MSLTLTRSLTKFLSIPVIITQYLSKYIVLIFSHDNSMVILQTGKKKKQTYNLPNFNPANEETI